MRHPAFVSGAAQPWNAPISKRSRHGLTGHLPRARTRSPRRRNHPGGSAAHPSSKEHDEMAARVLISDALSPAAVAIFKERGLEVDFQPKLDASPEKVAELIGSFEGLAVRSATKVTAKVLDRASRLKVIGRAGIGVDNVDLPAATAKGIIVMNTPFGNSITTAEHAITLMLSPTGRLA